MAWLVCDVEEPRLSQEAQEVNDRVERERVASIAVDKLKRAHRLADGATWRRSKASTPTRIVSRTIVTKRGPNGEIEEFERYEMPVKPATQSGHQWPIPDPIIE